MPAFSRLVPFSSSTTKVHALTYLLGVSLFSISFLVFLNSSVSFVVTDLIGQKHGVGDVVGTLGFADEIVALVACPVWGLVSDRLGVRWVAATGYAVVAVALALFVQARNIYPQLLMARLLFAVGASATATMVTATLPALTSENDEEEEEADDGPLFNGLARTSKHTRDARLSAAFSVESELTITPERYTRSVSSDRTASTCNDENEAGSNGKASALAGFVGLFTGCGALVALALFLPLPARFGAVKGVTPAEAISYSFYVVAAIALAVSVFVFLGLRGLKGEDGKGWRVLFAREQVNDGQYHLEETKFRAIPYLHLIKDSLLLGVRDSRITLGYTGGFVARASTVAISLFIPLFVNTFFIRNGYCQGSPNDPSQDLKEECRAAYVLSSILTGVAQLCALICGPIFGYLSHKSGPINWPIVVSTIFGIIGYLLFPHLSSPEIKNVDGRGGGPFIFLVVALIGVSQIGAIVCSLGSLGQGVLAAEAPRAAPRGLNEASIEPGEDESTEDDPLISGSPAARGEAGARIRLKGSIAGVYSLCGGAAILILTKAGGYLFDKISTGAPFYMMAGFNAALLIISLMLDASKAYARH